MCRARVRKGNIQEEENQVFLCANAVHVKVTHFDKQYTIQRIGAIQVHYTRLPTVQSFLFGH